jgi:hypothetical protein
MLLAIDEIINISTDATVVVMGSRANAYDLPAALSQSDPVQFWQTIGGLGGDSLVAPGIQTDHAPPSVLAARDHFGTMESMQICWPADAGGVPAYKQSLFYLPLIEYQMANGIHFAPDQAALWLFVVRPDGTVFATAIQLMSYGGIGPSGDLDIGSGQFLNFLNQPVGAQVFGGQPPPQPWALRLWTWRFAPGHFSWMEWREFAGRNFSIPEFISRIPAAWTKPVTQTMLLSVPSPAVTYIWQVDSNGQPEQIIGGYPGSPIFHVSLIIGDSILVKRPWYQTFEGIEQVVDPAHVESALTAWRDIGLSCVWFLKVAGDIELPWPAGTVADYLFDETVTVLDPAWKPPCSWL